MNDSLYELLIARKTPVSAWLIRIGLAFVVLTTAILPMRYLGIFSFVIAALLAFSCWYFILPRLNVEYEYILLNHDLSIDVIYNRQSRKQLASFDIQTADIIAPECSARLRSYHPQKVYNYTSGKTDAVRYSIILTLGQAPACILFEPDEKMLKLMEPWMVSKMYRD